MNEKPILFSGPMVRAILENRKTMTRRVVKPQRPDWWPDYCIKAYQGYSLDEMKLFTPDRRPVVLPYSPGTRLWVRETWWGWGHLEETGNLTESSEPEMKFVWDEDHESLAYALDYPTRPDYEPFKMTPDSRDGWHKRPSIFMPRWASRLTLEITSVKVERVQDISEDDAMAEGIPMIDGHFPDYSAPGISWDTARASFVSLWDSINGKRPGCSWSENPWVWCISFKQVTL